MSQISKKLVVTSLTVLARLRGTLHAPLQRVWAHACLAAKIDTPLDSSVVILGVPEVHGTGRIALGKNLYLYRELYLETQETGRIGIGDDVVISRGSHIVSFSNVHIGNGTMIGEYVSVRDANHRIDTGGPIRTSGHDAAPIVIGHNVWLGRGVTVLAGVMIGDGAVIGANAVVTRDVPAHTVAVGIPAKPLLRREAA